MGEIGTVERQQGILLDQQHAELLGLVKTDCSTSCFLDPQLGSSWNLKLGQLAILPRIKSFHREVFEWQRQWGWIECLRGVDNNFQTLGGISMGITNRRIHLQRSTSSMMTVSRCRLKRAFNAQST